MAPHGHALVTLYVQFLCSDWSKFLRWVLVENYALSWNLFTLTAEAGRVLCQLVIFLTVFFHCMYKMLSRVFVFVFHFAWCVRGFKSLKRFWSYLIAFRSCISNGKPDQLLYLMFVFCVRGTRTQPLICFGCPLQLIREVFSRLYSSSSSTHICFVLKRLVTFCLTLTR